GCAVQNDGCAGGEVLDSLLGRLLARDPDRYLFPALLRGADLPLPPEIAAGLEDVSRRGAWDRQAPPEYGLPAETWREHVARRARCRDVRARLRAAEPISLDDLVTLNLDLRRAA